MDQPEKLLRVKSATQVPGHSMYADWALPHREYSYISLIDLARQLGPGRKPVLIAHKDICAKPADWQGDNAFEGQRFEQADPRYPGLLVKNMPNPCWLPYRMVDGRRRLEKLHRMGFKQSQIVVFDYEETLPFVFDFEIID